MVDKKNHFKQTIKYARWNIKIPQLNAKNTLNILNIDYLPGCSVYYIRGSQPVSSEILSGGREILAGKSLYFLKNSLTVF